MSDGIQVHVLDEKGWEVDSQQNFHSEEYGIMIDAHERYRVRADLARRWIEEGRAQPVIEAAEKKTQQ